IKNGEITLKEKLSINRLVDSFSQRIVYKPAIFVVNKSDTHKGHKYEDLIYISADNGDGIEALKEIIWKNLKLITVYLVEKDAKPNMDNYIIMKEGETLLDVAQKIGNEFAEATNLAKIWGNGAKFEGQEIPLTTTVVDGMQIRFI
ncbi:MAG TPA: TGS domain-containing protein, partial [Patescibacteria group bacterium]|nr:TGS domain-containing protein [Patescibacteria group bacterium]